MTGIVLGCFAPLHKGHMQMIEQAVNECDSVIIVICGHKNDRGDYIIPFVERQRLMQEYINNELSGHNIKTVVVDDYKIHPDGDFSKTDWNGWCVVLFSQIDPHQPYRWYTGEQSYIDEIKRLRPTDEFVKMDKCKVDISSTRIRVSLSLGSDSNNIFIAKNYYDYIIRNSKTLKNGGHNNMKLKPIINSLLETDLYKFSMGQAIYHQFSDYKTTWTFKCRNKNVKFTPEMVDEIKEQIKHFCTLRFTEDELQYLDNIQWIKGSYVDFLRLWQPRFEDFEISTEGDCGLSIETKGTWLNTSMYEIPTLAIVNEVYFRMKYDYMDLLDSFVQRLDEKAEWLHKGKYYPSTFSEFGLRRRLSAEAQELAVKKFSEIRICAGEFIGTSNVYLAKKYGVKPVGTMAHEWIMCVGQGNHKLNPAYSNWFAMDAWVKEYGVLNGTALTDAITTDCFLKDFQLTFATLFSGVRHDSGDPIDWGEKMIAHYESLGIDPKTKTLLFSDSLNFVTADAIFRHFSGRAKIAFGIGTYLSNDTKVEPLNIVMKTTKCNGWDVAKISDTPGKGMCQNTEYIDYLTRCINYRMAEEG